MTLLTSEMNTVTHMKPLTLKEIAKAVGGRINNAGYEDIAITGVSTDSREDMSGKIFIPFKGANVDGHSFIGEVFSKGAAASLSEMDDLAFKEPVIYVKSIKHAIMQMAEYYRSLFNVSVVGITGSTGKTTTKDIIASVLSQQYDVLKTEGNFNNEIGLPLTMLKMNEKTQYAVIEMGMSGFGEIHNLSRIAKPQIAVITNIGVSHIENLGSREGILKAKSEIFDFMPQDGIAVLNADDDMLVTLKGKRENLIFFGTGTDNDFYAADIQYNGIRGVNFTLKKKCGENILIHVPAPGFHMVLNSLCAAAVGTAAGLSLEQIKKGIEQFRPSNMRMEILKNKVGVNIINDVYNANPASVKAALDVLNHADGEKVCILGDMLELGERSERMHYETGEYAAKLNIDYILTFGDKSRFMHEGALSKIQSFNSTSTALHFSDKEEIVEYAKEILKYGFSVLIKASRGMKFEDITKRLNI